MYLGMDASDRWVHGTWFLGLGMGLMHSSSQDAARISDRSHARQQKSKAKAQSQIPSVLLGEWHSDHQKSRTQISELQTPPKHEHSPEQILVPKCQSHIPSPVQVSELRRAEARTHNPSPSMRSRAESGRCPVRRTLRLRSPCLL